jgi:toxin-antitoxin system PIN domain toxin
MMRALLDINVLLALFDSDHVDHACTREWLAAEIPHGWASCAITQNGFTRFISQPRYPSPIPVTQAIRRLAGATQSDRHEFWNCDLSLIDPRIIDSTRVHGPRQVTDVYLLALAIAHGGRFVTFDRAIPLEAVTGASSANLVVL